MKKKLFFIMIICLLLENSAFAKVRQTSLIITDSGKILYQNNAKRQMYPASLAKMMSIYVVFGALKHQRINLDNKIILSKKAANMPSVKLGIGKGAQIKVKDAILSLIVKSSNDIAVALAENIAGTEDKFVSIMNKKAKRLGMNNTRFVNASGWHHKKQVTTAYDMAKLAIALRRDFPDLYELFSKSSFSYKNTYYKNYNYVIHHLEGAEGLKTGYNSKAGWNIVTAARRNDRRLIGVILGGSSPMERDVQMIKMMNQQFEKLGVGRGYFSRYY